MGVTLRRRRGWFHLDISEGGRRLRKSLHTQDPKKARLIRHEVESALLKLLRFASQHLLARGKPPATMACKRASRTTVPELFHRGGPEGLSSQSSFPGRDPPVSGAEITIFHDPAGRGP